MTLQNFSVVFFYEENRYSVVPSTWILDTEDGLYARWPGNRKNSSLLIRSTTSVPDDGWSKYPVQFVKSYDSYGRAYQKAETLRKSNTLEIVDSSDDPLGSKTSVFINEPVLPPSVFSTFTSDTNSIAESNNLCTKEPNSDIEAGPPQVVYHYNVDHLDSFETFLTEFKAFEVTFKKQEEILQELHDVKGTLRSLTLTPNGQSPRAFAYGILPRKTE